MILFKGLPECSTFDDVGKMQTIVGGFYRSFIINPSNFSYNVPCKQRQFSYSIDYFHRNSWRSEKLGMNVFYIKFVYDLSMVKNRIETLVYDWGTLISAFGGNVGFLLGASCLSFMIYGISLLKRFNLRFFVKK